MALKTLNKEVRWVEEKDTREYEKWVVARVESSGHVGESCHFHVQRLLCFHEAEKSFTCIRSESYSFDLITEDGDVSYIFKLSSVETERL